MSQTEDSSMRASPEAFWRASIASLRYRDYRLVWLGSITEHVGEFMQIVAILWLAKELTGSALMLTIVGSARYMPLIFLPIVGGVVADRMNRRTLLASALIGASGISIALSFLAVTNALVLWHLIAANALGGMLTAFNHPARSTIIPNLVKREHLLNAISLDSISVQASDMIGAVIAGYVIAVSGTAPIFIIRAIGGFAALIWLLQAKIPPTPAATRQQSARSNMFEGFRYLRQNTVVMILIFLFIVPTLAQRTYVNLLPIFTDDILKVGAVGYGYFQSAPGFGAILALLVLTALTYYRGKARLLLGASVLMGLGLISFSISRWVPLSLPILVITGGSFTIMMTVNAALMQSSIPDAVRGRVMSWREIPKGIGPSASILFGGIAQSMGVQLSLGLLGGLLLLSTLPIIFMLPKLRHVE